MHRESDTLRGEHVRFDWGSSAAPASVRLHSQFYSRLHHARELQRHEATSQEGVKKYHLCLSIPINSLSLLITCTTHSLCSFQTRLVLILYFTRQCTFCCMAQAVRVEGSALDISALSLHAHLIAECAWTPSSTRVLCNRTSIRE